MTDLNEMWAALEQYQPYADKAGHGESWKRMTTERTSEAAEAALWYARSVRAGSAAADAANVMWDAEDVTMVTGAAAVFIAALAIVAAAAAWGGAAMPPMAAVGMAVTAVLGAAASVAAKTAKSKWRIARAIEHINQAMKETTP